MSSSPMLPGQIELGNIDLRDRPSVRNPDGGYSTVLSIGIGEIDSKGNPVEVVIPRVVNGAIMSPDEAEDYYRKTGQHLGKFLNVPAANEMGQRIHLQQQMAPMIKMLMNAFKF